MAGVRSLPAARFPWFTGITRQFRSQTARSFAGFPKSRRRKVSQYRGQDSVRTKGPYSSETSTTTTIFEGDRYRSVLLFLPILVALVSLHRVPIRYQSSAFRRRSPTPRPSLEVVRHEQTRMFAIVRKCAEKGRNSRNPEDRWSEVEEYRGILSYRGGNLKQTGEFTFARGTSLRFLPSFSILRGRRHSRYFTRFALGNRNRYTARMRTVGWQNSGHTNLVSRMHWYFVPTNGTVVAAQLRERAVRDPIADSRALKW